MLGFSKKQSVETTKQPIVLVWQQVNQPKQFSTFSKTPKSKTISCFDKTTGCFSLTFEKHLNSKKVLKHISFRFNKEWITLLNYPDPTPNTTTIPTLHQTLGFGFFKALDHSWSLLINNLPLFDEDKSLVACVGLLFESEAVPAKQKLVQYKASIVAV